MALQFLDKLNYNEIENGQRSVILIYIIKKYFTPAKKARSISARGSFDSYFLFGCHSPPQRLFFILWTVDAVWLDYDDIENE